MKLETSWGFWNWPIHWKSFIVEGVSAAPRNGGSATLARATGESLVCKCGPVNRWVLP